MSSIASPPYRRPLLHPGLIAAGSTLLMAAFATDLAYWRTMLFQWNNFSGWLLLGGLVLAFLAAIALIVDVVSKRMGPIGWLRFLGLVIAALLALLNVFVHSRDSATAVIPEGIILSGVTTVLLLAIGLTGGWSLEARRASFFSRQVVPS